MIYFILFGAALLVAAAGYWLVCQSRDSKPLRYFRCPSCDQKLRFEAGNEGRRIMCPRCLKSCTLSEAKSEKHPDPQPTSAFHARRR
jgi:hypothetical protein